MRIRFRHTLSVIGILFLIVALILVSTTIAKNNRCTKETTATFVDYVEDYDSDNGVAYFPVVSYTVNHEIIQSQSNTGSSKKPYEIGETITIKYNPDRPEEYVFANDRSIIRWGIYLIIVALFCIAFDNGLIRRRR